MDRRMNRSHTRPDGERGVSNVVSIVLMIAVAVVLAGVVGAGFLTIGQSPSEPTQAGASLTWNSGTDAGEVRVTFVSRGDAEHLVVRYDILTAPTSNSVSVTNGSTVLDDPGDTMTIREDPGNSDEDLRIEVTVVAVATSGEESVVAERTETI